jgi:hypothetical protein
MGAKCCTGKLIELGRLYSPMPHVDAMVMFLPALILCRNGAGMPLFLARALVLLQNNPMIY